MPTDVAHKTKVIYINGRGHSGSTLLGLLIGSHSKVASIGEIKPQRIVRLLPPLSHETFCDCGATLADCDFWRSVQEEMTDRGLSDPSDYASGDPVTLKAFVGSVLSKAGASIYCDSTKTQTRLDHLRAHPSLDVKVVHLVRDPRAVAFSHQRKKGKSLLGRLRVKQSLHFPRHKDTMTLRYEDMATNPAEALRRVMSFVGEEFEPSQLQFRDHSHHSVSGNRMRHGKSSEIRADTKYLDEISSLDWFVMTLALLPTLLRFGYPLTRQGSREMLLPQSSLQILTSA